MFYTFMKIDAKVASGKVETSNMIITDVTPAWEGFRGARISTLLEWLHAHDFHVYVSNTQDKKGRKLPRLYA